MTEAKLEHVSLRDKPHLPKNAPGKTLVKLLGTPLVIIPALLLAIALVVPFMPTQSLLAAPARQRCRLAARGCAAGCDPAQTTRRRRRPRRRDRGERCGFRGGGRR